jgi:hypothetical protein
LQALIISSILIFSIKWLIDDAADTRETVHHIIKDDSIYVMMDTSIKDKSMNSYLEETLLPLIVSIVPKPTESYLLIASGLGDRTSQNGILIQLGNRLEIFWNKVISDYAINLIERNNKIKIGSTNRQLDHLFTLKTNPDIIYYLEAKCNLNFDTEKKPASNDKVEAIKSVLFETYHKEVKYGYFVPCIQDIPNQVIKSYSNIHIYGVEWMLEILEDVPFTCTEFFEFFQNVIGPIIEEKITYAT